MQYSPCLNKGSFSFRHLTTFMRRQRSVRWVAGRRDKIPILRVSFSSAFALASSLSPIIVPPSSCFRVRATLVNVSFSMASTVVEGGARQKRRDCRASSTVLRDIAQVQCCVLRDAHTLRHPAPAPAAPPVADTLEPVHRTIMLAQHKHRAASRAYAGSHLLSYFIGFFPVFHTQVSG